MSCACACAQTLDFAFVAVKATCAVEFYPDFGWTCVETAGKDITPFGDVRASRVVRVASRVVRVVSCAACVVSCRAQLDDVP